jgi:hypothetical protein
MHKLWVSHPKMTVEIATDDDGVIGMCAPIVGRFAGQPMANLFRWLNSLGPGLEVKEMGDDKDND